MAESCVISVHFIGSDSTESATQGPSSSRPKLSTLLGRSSGRPSRSRQSSCPRGQAQAQQLILALVHTLRLSQTSQISLPNLQTITVNFVAQAGVQYTQGEDTNFPIGIQIKEEPDSEEWQLSGNSMHNLRVPMRDEEIDTAGGESRRLRRVACTSTHA
ncbi:transcription factor Sp3-like [Sander lucioperca]|uniref:transcription factor Sp3-like n=1 Tax=Sander lucioperca TaxID=283035 RepID=UPI001653654A|nr:transcription factor Sp3-like [Sander lucioperca]